VSVRVLLAAAPPAVALLLLLARVGPVWAAGAALLSGSAIAAIAFPAPPGAVAGAEREVLLTALEVVLIVLGGVWLSAIMGVSGAQRELAGWLGRMCRSPARSVLLIVLGITPFAESVTGFGVGVMVAVPLLRRLDFPPSRAAVLSLLGLVIVPWGALAPGTLVNARLSGVSFHDLGVESALLSLPVFLIAGAAALLIAVGGREAARTAPELVAVAGALWVGVLMVNLVVGTPLAGALGSLPAIAVALLLARVRDRARPVTTGATRRALLPYAVLIGSLLAARGLVALAGGEQAAGWWGRLIESPATALILTCLLAPALLGRPEAARPAVLGAAVRRWWPVAVTTLLFLVLGGLMAATAMSASLATAATGLGPGYLLLAPWIGGLGGFLTGSNTGANAMFAAAQADAARLLGDPALRLAAIQNVSASLTTMASPSRVALAVGLLPDREDAAPAGRPGAPIPDSPREATPVDKVLRPLLAVDAVILAVLSLVAIAIR